MSLEQEKYQVERKKYGMISSGMFLVVMAMIAGLAYVSIDNIQKKKELVENKTRLQETYKALSDSTEKLAERSQELNRAISALKAAELIHENFVDSIISVGSAMQQKKAEEVKAQVSQISEKIKTDEQTNKDFKKIERLADELDGEGKEWTQEEIKEKQAEYEKIQRSNPAVDAVIRANDKLRDTEAYQQSRKPTTANPISAGSGNSATPQFLVVTSREDVWLKEGYFKLYAEANKLKINLLELGNAQVRMKCGFVDSNEFPDWTFTLKEGESKTFTKGDQKIMIDFVRTGAAGRNPLKKAMFYNLKVLKKQ